MGESPKDLEMNSLPRKRSSKTKLKCREEKREREKGGQMEKEKEIICSVSSKPLLTCANITVQF